MAQEHNIYLLPLNLDCTFVRKSTGVYLKILLRRESTCIKDATHDITEESSAKQRAKFVPFRGALLRYIDEVVGGVDKLAFRHLQAGRRDQKA